MDKAAFFITLALALVSSVLCTPVLEASKNVGAPETDSLTLKYLGTVNGKSYFLEDTEAMTWAEAWHFCNNSNMALASVKTQEEREFLERELKPYYKPGGPYNDYWLSAKEAVGRGWTTNWIGGPPIIRLETQVNITLFWDSVPGIEDHRYCGLMSIVKPLYDEIIVYGHSGFCTWGNLVLCHHMGN